MRVTDSSASSLTPSPIGHVTLRTRSSPGPGMRSLLPPVGRPCSRTLRGGEPVFAPWEKGQDLPAWDWIVDAAEQVLWMPYVTNVGLISASATTGPRSTGRVCRLAQPRRPPEHHPAQRPVFRGQGAPVTRRRGAVITRELTPKPRYGDRAFERDRVTPNASDWAFRSSRPGPGRASLGPGSALPADGRRRRRLRHHRGHRDGRGSTTPRLTPPSSRRSSWSAAGTSWSARRTARRSGRSNSRPPRPRTRRSSPRPTAATWSSLMTTHRVPYPDG